MTAAFRIGDREIGGDAPTFVIAEIGSNHDGKFAQAERYIEAAAGSGADAVKFQTIVLDQLLATTIAVDGEYRNEGPRTTAQFVETPEEWYEPLFALARGLGLVPFSSPFCIDAVDFLVDVGAPAMKLASGELTNVALLDKVAATGLPVIVSTGLASLAEVANAVDRLKSAGTKEIALLHCVSQYPTPFEDVNLRAIGTLGCAFETIVGLSDHTPGSTTAVAAVALGARIIEKHITFDRNAPGVDHSFAMEADEFAAMVRQIREVEAALGSGEKVPSEAERKRRAVVRRGLHTTRSLSQGDQITARDIVALRPQADAVRADELELVVGMRAPRDYPKGAPLCWADFG